MSFDWFFKTIVVSALPLLIRILAFFVLGMPENASMWHLVDFVFFGLSMSLSCIIQIQSARGNNENWRKVHSFLIWLVIMIVFLAFILGAFYMNEMLSQPIIQESVAIISALPIIATSLIIILVLVCAFKVNKN